jgi:hypothetical protein
MAPLNARDESTFYGGAEDGYTNYPALGSQFVPNRHKVNTP